MKSHEITRQEFEKKMGELKATHQKEITELGANIQQE